MATESATEKPRSPYDSRAVTGNEPEANRYNETTVVTPELTADDGQTVSPESLRELMDIKGRERITSLSELKAIGMGGIGAVFSAQEPVLNREVALKILRPHFRNKLRFVEDFIREARITARIDHPNVIPVHELGVFDDVGAFFTMKRVEGETLLAVLKKLDGGDEAYQRRYTLSRLLGIFIAICNGVAFAHRKGVIHRDLKPGNIMLGEFGEVFIMDWGLAEYREEFDQSAGGGRSNLPGGSSTRGGGAVSGTPAYMSPEQARGLNGEIDELSDLYSLGAILYTMLTWKASPFERNTKMDDILRGAIAGGFKSPRRRAPRRHIPYELEAICLKAMARKKSARYPGVRELIADVRNFQDKYPVSAYSPHLWYRIYKFLRRRPLVPTTFTVALLTLGIWVGVESWRNRVEADSLLTLAQQDIRKGDIARQIAMTNYMQLERWQRRHAESELSTGSAGLLNRFTRNRFDYESYFNSSLELLLRIERLNRHDPETVPMIARLLSNFFEFALLTGNWDLAKRTMTRVNQMPDSLLRALLKVPVLARQIMIVDRNQGYLELTADRPGMLVFSEPLEREELPRLLGKTPLSATLKAGKYSLRVVSEDGDKVILPITVRCAHTEKIAISVPRGVPENLVYVPAGDFIFGNPIGDGMAARIWLPGFFITRHEVTIDSYRKFWETLSDAEMRLRYLPNLTVAPEGRRTVPLWDEEGRLRKPYTENMPVVGISGAAAKAYCEYMSRRTGMLWRLPTALEWEKAARGTDGRNYVWGEYDAPQRTLVRENADAVRRYPAGAPVGSFKTDVSVYGIADLSGNVRELVTNPGKDPYFSVKGGSYQTGIGWARPAANSYNYIGSNDVGFRCVVGLPGKEKR